MRVLITTDHHFSRAPDGAIHSMTGGREYAYWQRYLDVFDEVVVLARVARGQCPPTPDSKADGPAVGFIPLPDFVGPAHYLPNALEIRKTARAAWRTQPAIILHAPGTVTHVVWQGLCKQHYPYSVEVVSDPRDAFAPRAVRHPLRPFFRWWFAYLLRGECADACAAAYVTSQTLQQRYPCPNYSIGVSDVQISEASLVPAPRVENPHKKDFQLVAVGSLAQLYKAPDILLAAVADCLRAGLDLQLTLIGDGKHRAELEAYAASLGLGERVRFLGQLPAGQAVRAELDQADLFVMPSRAEGLPRAMIEAMARALPCIGSTVGGIPELLPAEDLVPPDDVAALAAKIGSVLTDSKRMAEMSARNLAKACEYQEDVLYAQRIAFYRQVRESTEAWLAQQAR